MVMDFFKGFSTVEEIKIEYKRLARIYHPDLGGDLETMKRLNNEYEAALKSCNGQKSSGSDGRQHTYRYDQTIENEIVEFIYAFLALETGLSADLIGVWVWITGDTKPHRDALKALGCRWNPSRACWYFRPTSCAGSYGRGGSLEELASKYGCLSVSAYKDRSKKGKGKKKQLTA